MRLLNVHSHKFGEFLGENIPEYCILSHRWGEREVSYKDFCKGNNSNGPGQRKIEAFCNFVKTQPFQSWDQRSTNTYKERKIDWMWVDTCCIDKRSSAELSEAINSMFKWYASSWHCVVYLQDVPTNLSETELWQAFQASEWFLRGWTLQELVAPRMVVFCNAGWEIIGHLCEDITRIRNSISKKCWHHSMYGPRIVDLVSDVTTIPGDYLPLSWRSVDEASIAQRMSWAANRQTTRVEDEAYCLLGLFGINMPLIYGEGRKAFYRLQEEIVKSSVDQSIFAWITPGPEDGIVSGWEDGMFQSVLDMQPLFALSPRAFLHSRNIRSIRAFPELPPSFTITNRGLEIDIESHQLLRMKRKIEEGLWEEFVSMTLKCFIAPYALHVDETKCVQVKITLIQNMDSTFTRVGCPSFDGTFQGATQATSWLDEQRPGFGRDIRKMGIITGGPDFV